MPAQPLTQVFYSSPEEAVAVTPVSFVSATNGSPVPTDPSSITCVLFDPAGGTTNFTYEEGGSGLGAIVRRSTGNYTLTVEALDIAGLYTFTWVGSGNGVQQVIPGTFRLMPLSDVGTGMQYWYVGKEELKHRLNINDGKNDYEIALAIQTVTNWINTYTGRHFYQLQEARTFVPTSVWECPVDDLVSAPGVVENTLVTLDYNGNGVYDVEWDYGVNYQLKISGLGNSEDNYNINAGGVPRPFRQLQVLTGIAGNAAVEGGGWLPWLWPYTYLNRVKIQGTWGWNTIPPNVTMAAMMLTVDLYKSKDAPWGVAGVNDLGLVKVQSNPWVVELLHDFINMRRKAGV